MNELVYVKPSRPRKPLGPTARARARKRRKAQEGVGEVRAYVFEREKGVCRCCGYMPAESMHELKPRSVGGKVSRDNSIAVCGDGVRGCHGKLQRHEITHRFDKHRSADHWMCFRGLYSFPDVERPSPPGSGHITCEWV